MQKEKQPDQIDRDAGARLRNVRTLRGISQSALAKEIDVTFQQVQKYEKGTNRISLSKLVHICRALGCEASDIIGPIHEADDNEARIELTTRTAGRISAERTLAKIAKLVIGNAHESLHA